MITKQTPTTLELEYDTKWFLTTGMFAIIVALAGFGLVQVFYGMDWLTLAVILVFVAAGAFMLFKAARVTTVLSKDGNSTVTIKPLFGAGTSVRTVARDEIAGVFYATTYNEGDIVSWRDGSHIALVLQDGSKIMIDFHWATAGNGDLTRMLRPGGNKPVKPLAQEAQQVADMLGVELTNQQLRWLKPLR